MALFSFFRKRNQSKRHSIATLLLLGGMALSSPAYAEGLTSTATIVEESPRWFTFSFGGGVFQPDQELLKTTYGEWKTTFDTRISVNLFSMVDFGLSGGFQQTTGSGVGALDGESSDDLFRLTLYPMTARATLYLDLFDEQPVVPFIGGGVTYIEYRERDIYGNEDWTGNEHGSVLSAGLMILLDVFELGRAEDLDQSSGINDTYFVIQADQFTVDRLGKGADLDLSGLKLTGQFLFAF